MPPASESQTTVYKQGPNPNSHMLMLLPSEAVGASKQPSTENTKDSLYSLSLDY